MIEEYLVETLLTAILMLNASAFTLLWRRTSDNSEAIDDLEEELRMIWLRIFGAKEDETDEGHLVETQNQFETIREDIESLSNRFESANDQRRKEHREVKEAIENMADRLGKAESVGDINREDFEF